MQATKSDTYKAKAECQNCGKKALVDVPKGEPIKLHPCPVCGVKALEPAWSYRRKGIIANP